MGKIFKALEKSLEIDSHIRNDHLQEIVLDDRETVSMENGLDLFGTGTLDPIIVSGLKPHSMEAEQFRILKNNILFPETGKPPRIVLITSKFPGEGKSFVSANLAVSIARSIDEYVLLMDCDLRAPTIHSKFGFEAAPGLSEYLTDGRPLSRIFRKTQINKLTILPAGTPPANPSELLSSEQMKRLVQEVKSRYDDRYIIIDSPPPHITSESSALARLVDGIVIVVKAGSTRKQDIQDLIDAYGKKNILGVVMNFADKQQNYGYKNYYSYQGNKG